MLCIFDNALHFIPFLSKKLCFLDQNEVFWNGTQRKQKNEKLNLIETKE